MVNPSAARHLTLVVGVLLCFFVYMGYHIMNRQAAEPDSEHAGLEVASAASELPASTADSFALMTSSENTQSGSNGSDNASVNMPSGLPLPIGSLDNGELEISNRESGQLSLADDLIAMSEGGGMSVPSGSFEEADDIITGFTTDIPALALPGQSSESDTAALSDGFVPPPPMAGGQSNAQPPAPAGSVESIAANPAVSLPPPPGANNPPPTTRVPVAQQNFPTSASNQPSGNRPGMGTAVTTAPNGAREQVSTYVIRPGDTLSSIAARELGLISLADNIYLMNRDVIFNPDYLLVGTTIKLPPTPSRYSDIADPVAQASGIRGGMTNTTPQPPPHQRPVVPVLGARQNPGTDPADGVRRYRIRSGDTLSSIALQFYGSSSGWRFLYEANSTVIPNPNQLTIGTEIVIPSYGER